MTGWLRLQRWLLTSALENLPLKLLSLLVSLLIYAYLHGAQNAQVVRSVSVVVLLPPEESRVLLVEPPAAVQVTLLGSRPNLDELRTDELGSVQLDLRRNPGTYASFDLSTLRLPAGVRAEVDPPGIRLLWDTLIVRPIAVQIPVAGQPAHGFVVQGDPEAEPAVVSARGPQSLVETLQFAQSEPFDVAGLAIEGPTTRKLLLAPPPRVQLLERSVLATVKLVRARSDRTFERLAVQAAGAPHATARPAEVDVRVSGPSEIVDALRPELIVPIADVRALAADKRAGTAAVPVTVALEGCSVQIVPPTVVVKW